jgi:hypothetical protein
MHNSSYQKAGIQQETYISLVRKSDHQPLLLSLPSSSYAMKEHDGLISASNGDAARREAKWSKHRSSFFIILATVVVATALFAVGSNFVLMTPSPLVGNFQKPKSNLHDTRETIDEMLLSLECMVTAFSPPLDQRHQGIASTSNMDILSTSISSHKSDDSSSTQLVYLNQSNAYEILWRSLYNQHYFAYQTGLDVQKNQAYCGAATVVAVLNSLRVINTTALSADGIDLPTTTIYKPYLYATQSNIYNQCTQNTVISISNNEDNPAMLESTIDGILTLPYGLNLEQVASLLQCHLSSEQWNIQAFHATPATAQFPAAALGENILPDEELHLRQQMKSIMIEALRKPRSRLLINYHRLWLGQAGGGHFSPIGAYNEENDSFLILDVSKYKYPPVWASFAQIYHSMSTIDSCGFWNWPSAQAKLPDDLRRGLPPSNEEEYEAAMQLLGCTPTYRGFIVVDEIEI